MTVTPVQGVCSIFVATFHFEGPAHSQAVFESIEVSCVHKHKYIIYLFFNTGQPQKYFLQVEKTSSGGLQIVFKPQYFQSLPSFDKDLLKGTQPADINKSNRNMAVAFIVEKTRVGPHKSLSAVVA